MKHDRPVDPPPPAGSFEAPADFAPAPLSGIPSRGPEGADAARRPDSRPDEDELAILRRFVESLVTRACNGPECPVRMVLRAGRLIELRVEPATAAALCGGPDAMQVLIRRWVELRWVRRVRPVLVLERRAIEAATALPHGVKAKAPH